MTATTPQPRARRWVSVTEACEAIRGQRDRVAAWLYARGLVRRSPWGAEGVDLDAAMAQLAAEAPPVPVPEGRIAALVPPPAEVPPTPAQAAALPRVAPPAPPRRGRPRKAQEGPAGAHPAL